MLWLLMLQEKGSLGRRLPDADGKHNAISSSTGWGLPKRSASEPLMLP